MDVNGDGYITHSELEKALTTVSYLKHFVFDRYYCYCSGLMFWFWLQLLILSELSELRNQAN